MAKGKQAAGQKAKAAASGMQSNDNVDCIAHCCLGDDGKKGGKLKPAQSIKVMHNHFFFYLRVLTTRLLIGPSYPLRKTRQGN